MAREVTNKEAMKVLLTVKKAFAPLKMETKKDFKVLIPELWDIVKKENLKDVTLFDGKYYYNGRTKRKSKYKGGELLSYAPIKIHIAPENGPWFYFYDNGNWDIAQDINRLRPHIFGKAVA